MGVEIVLAEDGKYYVDATSTASDDIVRASGQRCPFDTERKVRENLKW
jgi:hypothetical protein